MGCFCQKAERGSVIVTGFAKTWRLRTGERLSRIATRMHAKRKAGSAAIECAFVAPVFFLFLMATIEVGIMFMADIVLQNATSDAARQIRTGQVVLSGMTQDGFRNLICSQIDPLLKCDSNLQIDVETFPSFGAVTMTPPIRPDGTLDPSLKNWAPGNVCSIVLVRSFYTWTVATPLLTPFLINMSNNQHLLSAAAAFRSEPYTTAVSGC